MASFKGQEMLAAHKTLDLLKKENVRIKKILSNLEKNNTDLYHDILKKMCCARTKEENVRDILDDRVKVTCETKNSVLKILLKTYLGSDEYRKFEFLTSGVYDTNSDLNYDLVKNGQNIIKHGVDFANYYAWGNQPILITKSCRDNQEERNVTFYAMRIDDNTSLFLDENFKDETLVMLAVVSAKSTKRYISAEILSMDSESRKNRIMRLVNDCSRDDELKFKEEVANHVESEFKNYQPN